MEKQQFNIDDTNDKDALIDFVDWVKRYQELNLMSKGELIEKVIWLEDEMQSLMD